MKRGRAEVGRVGPSNEASIRAAEFQPDFKTTQVWLKIKITFFTVAKCTNTI